MSELQELKDRIAALESALGFANDKVTKISTHEIELVDASGAVRAKLHMSIDEQSPEYGNPELALYTSSGKKLVELAIDENHPNGETGSVKLYNEEEKPRLHLFAMKDQANINFISGNGRLQLSLSAASDWSLIELAPKFFTTEAFPLALRSSSDGATIEFWDRPHTGGDGTTGPLIYDSRMEISHKKVQDGDADSKITMLTKDDEVIFEAP